MLKKGLLLFTAGVTLCGCVSYEYIGLWKQFPNTRTYENPRHAVRVSFPDRNWQVFRSPREQGYPRALGWHAPRPAAPHATLLQAMVPGVGVIFKLLTEPNPASVGLEDYMQLSTASARAQGGGMVPERPEVIDRPGRRVGTVTMTGQPDQGPEYKVLIAVVREPDRFVTFVFGAPAVLFERKRHDFYTIVDSYRRTDGVTATPAAAPGAAPRAAPPASQPLEPRPVTAGPVVSRNETSDTGPCEGVRSIAPPLAGRLPRALAARGSTLR